jgi:hypothetical protein
MEDEEERSRVIVSVDGVFFFFDDRPIVDPSRVLYRVSILSVSLLDFVG